MDALTVVPIGVVRNEVQAHVRSGWVKIVSELVFDDVYTDALDGLEGFSHVMVLFWMDRPENYPSKGHVQNRPDYPIIWRFAGRGMYRPNPIGVTSVALISRDKNVLKVQGLDIIDGTPIIDIKPYIPAFDRVESPQTPDWARQIYEREDYF